MLLVIACILVFFPASIALVIHDRFFQKLVTTSQKWMWYGAYCAVISWAVLAVKLIRLGGAFDVLTAFAQIRQLVSYGLVSIVVAIAVPLAGSVLQLLFSRAREARRTGDE